jgi:hypothetical protein
MKIVVQDGADWCPVTDAARYLKKSTTHVRLLMGEGNLIYSRIGPDGSIYISVSDLTKTVVP